MRRARGASVAAHLRRALVTRHAAALNIVVPNPESTLMRSGEAARRWFLDNQRSFSERVGQAIAALGAPCGP